MRGEIRCGRGPAHHQGHPGALVDLNALGAGHAVAAAPAEIAHQLLPVLGDHGFQRQGHGGRLVDKGEEFFQLPLPLNAPDGQHMVKLRHPSGSCCGIQDQPAGQRLHGDVAHICLPAALDQGQLLRPGEIAQRKLQRFIKAGVDAVLRHGERVVRQADVADHAPALGLQHAFIHSGTVAGPVTDRRQMELVEVDVVCLE